jgi:hypothetical protein
LEAIFNIKHEHEGCFKDNSLYFETTVIKLKNLLEPNETGLVICQLIQDCLKHEKGIGTFFNILEAYIDKLLVNYRNTHHAGEARHVKVAMRLNRTFDQMMSPGRATFAGHFEVYELLIFRKSIIKKVSLEMMTIIAPLGWQHQQILTKQILISGKALRHLSTIITKAALQYSLNADPLCMDAITHLSLLISHLPLISSLTRRMTLFLSISSTMQRRPLILVVKFMVPTLTAKRTEKTI